MGVDFRKGSSELTFAGGNLYGLIQTFVGGKIYKDGMDRMRSIRKRRQRVGFARSLQEAPPKEEGSVAQKEDRRCSGQG